MNLIQRAKIAWNVMKRGFKFYDSSGKGISFEDWSSNFIETKNTPLLESVFTTFASEFSKLDFFVYREYQQGNEPKYDDMKNDHLNYLLQLRTNDYINAHDFKYIMGYQYSKYGKAIAIINRDNNGKVINYVPIDCNQYQFGQGFELINGKIIYKMRNKTTSKIELWPLDDLIIVRSNPNDIFYSDKSNPFDSTNTLTKLMDTQLNVLLNEMLESGEIRGIVEVGEATLGGLNQSLLGTEQKVTKQEELTDRIKKAKGGILVLDAGEKWHDLNKPFRTLSVDEQNSLTKLIYSIKGVNEKVINGTANESEMEIYHNKNIAPFAESFNLELNYRSISDIDRKRGVKIDYRRNPFEYISIDKATNCAYKGAMFTNVNEMRKMLYKFGPISGGDELLKNLNFDMKEDAKKNE